MANVINKTTLEIKNSVNTPDYNNDEWIINPNLDLVNGIPNKYWKIENDQVVEMTQQEKDNLDSDEFYNLKTNKIHVLWNACFDYQSSFFTEPIFTKMGEMKMLGDSRIADVESWINGLWNDYYTRRYLANHSTNENDLNTISVDFSNNGNPPYTVSQLLGVDL